MGNKVQKDTQEKAKQQIQVQKESAIKTDFMQACIDQEVAKIGEVAIENNTISTG